MAKFFGHGLGTQQEVNERERARVQAEAKQTNDPEDHSKKVEVSGRTFGERGTSMRGHANALSSLRSQTVKL